MPKNKQVKKNRVSQRGYITVSKTYKKANL